MKTRLRLLCALVLLCLVVPATAGLPASAQKTLYSFESPQELKDVHARGSSIARADDGATDGTKALRVVFEKTEWPNALVAAGDGKTWDWSGYGALVLDVKNPGAEAVEFFVRVDDDVKADGGPAHSRSGAATLAPGAAGSFWLGLESGTAKAMGMNAGPPLMDPLNATELKGGGAVDPKHITSLQIFLHSPPGKRTLLIDHLRLAPFKSTEAPYEKIVDRYGQYTGADWPGKIHTDAELTAARDDEQTALAAHPALNDRDAYGGWSAGPHFAPTGFFTTRQVDGRWWLVDPDGRLFFSTGLDEVTFHSHATVITKRKQMFTWLPEAKDPLSAYYVDLPYIHIGPIKSGRGFDFYAANVQRKFDAVDPRRAWEDETIARCRAWGFNTIGNWSDESLCQQKKVPYVVTANVGGNHKRVSGGWDYWAKMHDPYDPQFAADAAEWLKRQAAQAKDDPWCLGYFVDNELSWSAWGGPDGGRFALAHGTLSAGTDSPAKMAMLAQLKAKYQTIDQLNAAWKTALPSWEALAAPYGATGAITDAMKQDMSTFITAFARQYFTVVRNALKKLDPNHLYLGCRFAAFTEEEAKAAAEVCDVVSFNVYDRGIDIKRLAFTKELNKPCMIGEFHFGALDRGMFHPGLVPAADQKARAQMYREYVNSVADHPAFVGCHWFEYVDEPITGRAYDGENYNIGFVTVTDTPYPEMVAAAKQTHQALYTRRASARRKAQ